jgi:hypothetical protein
VLGGEVEGFVEVGAVEDDEAADLFLGFGEGSVGEQHFAVADADGGGFRRWAEAGAAADLAAAFEVFAPAAAAVVAVLRGRFVTADHQQVLHVRRPSGRGLFRRSFG